MIFFSKDDIIAEQNNLNTNQKQVQEVVPADTKLKADQIFEMFRSYIDRGELKDKISEIKAVYNFSITLSK